MSGYNCATITIKNIFFSSEQNDFVIVYLLAILNRNAVYCISAMIKVDVSFKISLGTNRGMEVA